MTIPHQEDLKLPDYADLSVVYAEPISLDLEAPYMGWTALRHTALGCISMRPGDVMRHTVFIIATLAALLAPTASARAGMEEDCMQVHDLDTKVSGCTAVIRSGQWQGKELAWAYNNRGLAYTYLGNPARAIEDYDQALRLDPGLAVAYLGRGVVYRNLGEHARAIEDYDEALRLDPDDAAAYRNRGIAYGTLGEYRRAIEDFDQALRLDAGFASAYNSRGFAYYKLGELTRAIEDYDEALRLDPGDDYARNNRRNALRRLGE